MVRVKVTNHFDGYLELVEDDSTLFRDPSEPVPSTYTAAPELLWYLGRHPKSESEPELDPNRGSGPVEAT